MARDVLESLTRSYLALGDSAMAQSTCSRLEKVGHLQNVLLLRQVGGQDKVHRTNVLLSRLELARSEKDTSSQQLGALLCNLLEIHPSSDRLWLYLADWYRARNCPRQEFYCLERAAACERSHSVPQLERLRQECDLEDGTKSEISSRLKNENKRKPTSEKQDASTEDFVDLGSSIKTREKEENLDKVKLDCEDDVNTIEMFEAKWMN